jgi:hypothetical protein
MAVPLAVFESEAPAAGHCEGDAVDPPGLVGAAVAFEPGAGEEFDAVELLAVDRAERAAEPVGAAGLDLAEDDGVGRACYEVEFAEAVPPVAGEDLHPVALEVGGRELLAEPAELVRGEPSQVHGGLGRCRVRSGGDLLRHRPASGRPGRGSRRTLPLPKSSIGSR